MTPGDKVIFGLGINAGTGEIVRVNDKTVIVKLPSGKKIKRHIEKHNVRLNNA